MALTKAAQDYLMAVDREKKKQMERGGQAAADSFVASQKKKASYLAGDDDKARTVNAARKRIARQAIQKASDISKGKPDFSPNKPNEVNIDPQESYNPNNAKITGNKPNQGTKKKGNNNPKGRGFLGDLLAPFS